jgi:rhodanese-related sulfurtransferase
VDKDHLAPTVMRQQTVDGGKVQPGLSVDLGLGRDFDVHCVSLPLPVEIAKWADQGNIDVVTKCAAKRSWPGPELAAQKPGPSPKQSPVDTVSHEDDSMHINKATNSFSLLQTPRSILFRSKPRLSLLVSPKCYSLILKSGLRDPREMEREGRMPGAFACTRGMLEFWIDPESPYAKPVFAESKRFVFFCDGGWRSALAAKTAQDMGLESVSHIDGGFGARKKAGGPVEAPKSKV